MICKNQLKNFLKVPDLKFEESRLALDPAEELSPFRANNTVLDQISEEDSQSESMTLKDKKHIPSLEGGVLLGYHNARYRFAKNRIDKMTTDITDTP